MGGRWEGRFKREGTYGHLWLIHVDVQQKSNQHCKTNHQQLKNKYLKKKKKDLVLIGNTKKKILIAV